MKSIFKAVAVVTMFSVITRALGFLFRIFLSRKLGAEGLGLFQMASSVLGVFLTLISSGIPLTTAKFVSIYEANNEYKKRNQIVSSSLVVSVILAIISCCVIFILSGLWNLIISDSRAVDILIVLTPSVLFSAIYSVFRGGLWGQKDYFNCGLTELIEQVVRFISTFILLYSVNDMYKATKLSAHAFNITCLISAIIVMIIYLRKSKLNFKNNQYKLLIKSAVPVTGVKVASSLVQPITALIIPSMLMLIGYSSSEAISSFGVMMGMTFPLLFVPMTVVGSISMVLIPSISALNAQNNLKQAEENISTSIKSAMFISILFVPLYLSVGNLIGLVLFNNALSGTLLQTASICVLPISLCNLTGSTLDALNLETKAFKNYILGSIVLIVSLLVFTPLVGINSIVFAFFLAMTIISLLNIRTLKKHNINLNFNIFKTSLIYTLIVIPSSLLGIFISGIMLNYFTNFFAGLIAGTISILTTITLVQTFNVYNLKDLIKIAVKKRKHS